MRAWTFDCEGPEAPTRSLMTDGLKRPTRVGLLAAEVTSSLWVWATELSRPSGRLDSPRPVMGLGSCLGFQRWVWAPIRSGPEAAKAAVWAWALTLAGPGAAEGRG